MKFVWIISSIYDGDEGIEETIEDIVATEKDGLDFLQKIISRYRDEEQERIEKNNYYLDVYQLRWVIIKNNDEAIAFLVWKHTGGMANRNQYSMKKHIVRESWDK